MEAYQQTARSIEMLLAVDEEATSQGADLLANHLKTRPDRMAAAAIARTNRALEIPDGFVLNEFRIVAGLAVVGLLSIVSIKSFGAVQAQSVVSTAELAKVQIQAQASIQQTQVEQQRAVADARSDNAIATPYEQLKITDYDFDPNSPPELNWVDEWSLSSGRTRVIDRTDRCVGFLDNAQFTFDPTGQGVCRQ